VIVGSSSIASLLPRVGGMVHGSNVTIQQGYPADQKADAVKSLLDDPEVPVIFDKLVIVQARVSGSTDCSKTSLFTLFCLGILI
jgi:hypothetical protein